jgi:Arc/MetJ family transcription regulator
MPTNLALDDELIQEAVEVGGHKTKREAVTAALQEYVRYRRQLRALQMAGQTNYDPRYDHKAERRRR